MCLRPARDVCCQSHKIKQTRPSYNLGSNLRVSAPKTLDGAELLKNAQKIKQKNPTLPHSYTHIVGDFKI